MRAKYALLTLGLAASVNSCAGTGQNTVDLYQPQANSITLEVAVPDDQAASITSVEFSVDGTPVATDNDGAPWSVQFDTTKVTNGVHYVKAVGNPGTEDVVLLENSILVNNAGGAAPAATDPAAYKIKKN